MSLNTAHANGGVLIFNGEIILLYCDGVEFTIEGSCAKDFSGTREGRLYLTTHRMIFTNKKEKDNLQSFSSAFYSLTGVELKQPVFGANYIKGNVTAEPGGNWTGTAVFKLKFFAGGAIEFGQAMLKTAQMARQHMPPQPPAYMPNQGPYYPAPPPAYMPPAGGVQGFVPPTNAFPDSPPPNSVYTSDMPPPYPGIYPPQYAYAPGSQYYPQAGPNGTVVNYPGNLPPPPGFNSYGMNASAPPAYDPQTQGAYAQSNGTNPQAPASEKTGLPPVYDFYEDANNPQLFYSHQNNHPNQGPPPPYCPDKKEQ